MTASTPFPVGTVQTGVTVNTLTATSATVTLASTTDKVLHLVTATAVNGTATAPVVNWPAGWQVLPGQAYVTDGSSPQLGGETRWKFHVAGVDPSSINLTFTAANVAWEAESWGNVDQHNPFSQVFQGPYTGTTTAKTTGSITTIARGIVKRIFFDRNGGGYTGGTGTLRGSVAMSSSVAIYSEDSYVNPTTSLSFAITGPNTSVGGSSIFRLNPAPPVPGQPLSGWLLRSRLDVAHRGAGSVEYPPEMTLQAYAKAVAYGMQALEASFWEDAEGVRWLSHDRSTLRITGVDLDIPTSSTAAIAALRTTDGSYPLGRLSELLDLWGHDQHIIFIENKRGTNNEGFLDFLDTYAGGTDRFVVKGPYNSTTAPAARARGYYTWNFWYSADLPNLSVYGYNSDLTGLNYDAPQSEWDQILALGLPTLGHVCLSVAAVTLARSKGATGVMTGKLTGGAVDPSGGAVALSGTGNLSLSGVPGFSGSLSLSATGSLALIAPPGKTGSGFWGATGSLSLLGSPGFAGSLALSASGSLGLSGSAPTQIQPIATVLDLETRLRAEPGSLAGPDLALAIMALREASAAARRAVGNPTAFDPAAGYVDDDVKAIILDLVMRRYAYDPAVYSFVVGEYSERRRYGEQQFTTSELARLRAAAGIAWSGTGSIATPSAYSAGYRFVDEELVY